MKKMCLTIWVMVMLCWSAFAAQNFVHKSGTVTVTDPASAIVAGTLVDLGDRYGVSSGAIATNDSSGTVFVSGIWRFQRVVTNAITQGTAIYYSSATGVTDVATADTYVGQCSKAVAVVTDLINSAGNVDQFIEVDINVPERQCIVGVDLQAWDAGLDTLATDDGSDLTGVWQADTNAATDETDYTPRYVGDILTGQDGAATGAVWVATGITSNDWTKI